MTTCWPDTTSTQPPADHAYASALWLIGRHPALARLAARVPDVVVQSLDAAVSADVVDGADLDEAPAGSRCKLELDVLAEAVDEYDAHAAAWAGYRRRRPEPRDEDAWGRWYDAGPQLSRRAASLGVMSRTELTRLRLLAALHYGGVRFSVSDLRGLDGQGAALLADWCRALQAY